MQNRWGLTRSAQKVLSADTYDLKKKPWNVRSITTITDDLKIQMLKKRHENGMTPKIDCQNRTFLMFGTAWHDLAEKVLKEDDSFMTEERWIVDIKTWDLHWITDSTIPIERQEWYSEKTQYLTGKLDCYDRNEGIIEDYKVIKTVAMKYPIRESYVWQVNIHKMALVIAGLPVNKGVITMFFRDWQNYDIFKKNFSTPPCRSVNVHLDDDSVIREYIRERIKLFVDADALEDDDIPPCENRYNKDSRCLSNEPTLWCSIRTSCNYYRDLVEIG